jgi:hypothetical protein
MKLQYDTGNLAVLDEENNEVFAISAENKGLYGNVTINSNPDGSVELVNSTGGVLFDSKNIEGPVQEDAADSLDQEEVIESESAT